MRLNPRVKRLITVGAKLAVAVLLVGWLVRGGSLDFGALRVLVDRPEILLLNMGVWLTCAVVLSTTRWLLLLRLAHVKVPFFRALSLQLTAVFFNVVIPGNVGGDVVKALYVAREAPPESKTTILLVVFVERILGLAGLVALGGSMVLFGHSPANALPELRAVKATLGLLALGFLLAPIIGVGVMRVWGERIAGIATGESRVSKIIARLLEAARLLSRRTRILALALLISIAMHAVSIYYFTQLTEAVRGVPCDFTSVATVFPIGLLSLVLPISLAGIGVGHVAFERLFLAIGLSSGATIFNIYLIGQLAPCLIGVIPYLFLRAKDPIPTAEEAEEKRT